MRSLKSFKIKYVNSNDIFSEFYVQLNLSIRNFLDEKKRNYSYYVLELSDVSNYRDKSMSLSFFSDFKPGSSDNNN